MPQSGEVLGVFENQQHKDKKKKPQPCNKTKIFVKYYFKASDLQKSKE